MFWISACLTLSVLAVPQPSRIIMKDGKILGTQSGFQIQNGFVKFRDRRGDYFSFPLRVVDVPRTYAAPKKKPIAAARRKLKWFETIWLDARYREKKKTFKIIAITNKELQKPSRSKVSQSVRNSAVPTRPKRE